MPILDVMRESQSLPIEWVDTWHGSIKDSQLSKVSEIKATSPVKKGCNYKHVIINCPFFVASCRTRTVLEARLLHNF